MTDFGPCLHVTEIFGTRAWKKLHPRNLSEKGQDDQVHHRQGVTVTTMHHTVQEPIRLPRPRPR